MINDISDSPYTLVRIREQNIRKNNPIGSYDEICVGYLLKYKFFFFFVEVSYECGEEFIVNS